MQTSLLFSLTSGWIERRKGHLLIFAIIMSVVWLLFLYFYSYRTFSVSGTHLQHELQTGTYLRTEHWDRVDLHHSFSDEKQSTVKNDSLKSVHDRRVDEYSRAAVVRNNSQFYSIPPHIPKTAHNDSHVRQTAVDKASIPQHQYSTVEHGNDAAKRLPAWLRWDPLVQKLLSQTNISRRSSLNDEFLEETSTTTKPVQRPLKPVSEPLLASGHKSSGHFEVDVRHSADIDKRVVVSVVDSGFTNFAVNFQRLSVDRIGLRNFLFVCIDREAVGILQQHGIACSYYRKSSSIQVTKTC